MNGCESYFYYSVSSGNPQDLVAQQEQNEDMMCITQLARNNIGLKVGESWESQRHDVKIIWRTDQA